MKEMNGTTLAYIIFFIINKDNKRMDIKEGNHWSSSITKSYSDD